MGVNQTLSVTETSYSITDNTSRVRINWISTQTGQSWNEYTRTAYYYVSINGGAETRYSVSYILPYQKTRTIIDTTITVPHNADGTGTIKVRTWLDTNIAEGIIQKSSTLKLTTIPRATTPTISGTQSLGSTIAIDTTGRASSSFTHNLYYSWGSSITDKLIASGIGGAKTSFTIPKTLAETVMAGTSGTMVIKCVTYNGSTNIGTKTVSITVSIPNTAEFQPTINTIAVAEGATVPVARYVKGWSNVKITVNAVGGYVSGSSNRNSFPASATITVDGTTYTKTLGQNAADSWVITTNTLRSAGTQTITVKVTDSRGRTATKTASIVVYEYSAPVISSFTAQRCTQDGTLDDSGIYVLLNLNATVSSIDSTNSKTYKIVYENNGSETTLKQGALSQYTNATVALNSYSVGVSFSVDSTFTVRCYVYDTFNTQTPAVATVRIPTEATFFDWRSNGKGWAFGKVSTKDGLECAWDMYDRNDFKIGIASKEISAGTGHIKYANGVLIQWGTIAITPTSANTVTSVNVAFPFAYEAAPHIGGNVLANNPQVITWGVGAGTTAAAALTGMVIYMTRTNVNATTFRWWAIGQAAED